MFVTQLWMTFSTNTYLGKAFFNEAFHDENHLSFVYPKRIGLKGEYNSLH